MTSRENGRLRPIAYDATHLVSRLVGPTATGVDFVDRAYARHFARGDRLACGLHYGAFAPHNLAPSFVAEISDFHQRKFALADDRQWTALRAWLTGEARLDAPPTPLRFEELIRRIRARAFQLRARTRDDHGDAPPREAIYLNVAQHGLEYARLFAWLDQRCDVTPVFLLHDLLPLDYPEFFRDGYETVFRARFETVLRRAGAIVTTAQVTAGRIAQEYRSRGRAAPPIHVQPLASPLDAEEDREALHDDELSAAPYFVVVATIEPRKNHQLLLNVWRELARREGAAPKLVCVGGRGLGASRLIDMIERSPALKPHIRLVSGLSSPAMRRLLANARALLQPSFAEGYGIPLVEAMGLRTPVICSDIAVFREVTRGAAAYVSPIDGLGWRNAVLGAAAARRAPPCAAGSPSWPEYFAGVESFLAGLP